MDERSQLLSIGFFKMEFKKYLFELIHTFIIGNPTLPYSRVKIKEFLVF